MNDSLSNFRHIHIDTQKNARDCPSVCQGLLIHTPWNMMYLPHDVDTELRHLHTQLIVCECVCAHVSLLWFATDIVPRKPVTTSPAV